MTRFVFDPGMFLTSTGVVPQITLQVGTKIFFVRVFRSRRSPALALPHLDGHYPCTRRFKGSSSLRSLPVGPVPNFQRSLPALPCLARRGRAGTRHSPTTATDDADEWQWPGTSEPGDFDPVTPVAERTQPAATGSAHVGPADLCVEDRK